MLCLVLRDGANLQEVKSYSTSPVRSCCAVVLYDSEDRLGKTRRTPRIVYDMRPDEPTCIESALGEWFKCMLVIVADVLAPKDERVTNVRGLHLPLGGREREGQRIPRSRVVR